MTQAREYQSKQYGRGLEYVRKKGFEKLRVTVEEWRGRRFVGLRMWWRPTSGLVDDWRPSKKGVTLEMQEIGELLAWLTKVKAWADGLKAPGRAGPGPDDEAHQPA